MVFSSIPFLFYFLPLVLALYFIVPRQLKNLVLFISSLIFYAWGEPVYVVLMIFSTLVDYTHGILIERYKNENRPKLAKGILISSIIINLSLLGFFKYTDFFILNLNNIFGTSIELLKLPLPIGISFYTFQTMSYSIDVYRGEVKAQKNIISFGAYVALFPQLIAGPIVQYKTIAKQLNERKETFDLFSQGVLRFVQGLGKKVIIANNIGFLWDTIAAKDISTVPVVMAWIGILAFSFQIYFDFSGYSDMAIGLGKMFGFSFLENFNYPYISKSITEFWRRWHISLGTWFREYVYIPLGGNRKGNQRTVFNIMVVWCLTGFWHGAEWNFMIWGLYFGIILILEKLFILKFFEKLPDIFKHVYAIFLIIIGWVIFALNDISTILNYIGALFGQNGAGLINGETLYMIKSYGFIFLILIIGSTPLPSKIFKALIGKFKNEYIIGIFESSFIIIILVICVAYIINSSYNPFLYFRF